MLPYKNVYSIQDGRLIKNKENRIEYYDEEGKKRVKTNPSYKDFAKVGMYPLKESGQADSKGEGATLSTTDVALYEKAEKYVIENGYILVMEDKK